MAAAMKQLIPTWL